MLLSRHQIQLLDSEQRMRQRQLYKLEYFLSKNYIVARTIDFELKLCKKICFLLDL